MKLTRRGLGKAAVGGAVAGPQVLKNIITHPDTPDYGISQSLNKYNTGAQTSEGFVESGPESGPINQKAYIAQRIERLKRVIAGDFSDYIKEDEFNPAHIIAENVSSLKSVSSVNKHLIAQGTLAKRRKRIWIENAKKELANYIKDGFA